jgi:hypothetical protein
MRAAPRRLDDASVRKMLLDNNYTNQEVDAYLRGEKDHPCHYEKCGNMGSNNDVWVPKRRVCKAHYTKQLIRMMLIFSGFLALLFGLLIAVA